MARTATTADAFNAIAEVKRREILDLLAQGERSVGELTRLLGIAQPQVSKHLRVLREVGVVEVQERGRLRLYRVNGHALKPVHDWLSSYARFWEERFEALDGVLEELQEQGREAEAEAEEEAEEEEGEDYGDEGDGEGDVAR